MMSSFRYVDAASDCSVNLFLFSSWTGKARARITGPVNRDARSGSKRFEKMSAMPLTEAFPSAIRLANRNDVEVVVTGDRTLWNKSWGHLSPPA